MAWSNSIALIKEIYFDTKNLALCQKFHGLKSLCAKGKKYIYRFKLHKYFPKKIKSIENSPEQEDIFGSDYTYGIQLSPGNKLHEKFCFMEPRNKSNEKHLRYTLGGKELLPGQMLRGQMSQW